MCNQGVKRIDLCAVKLEILHCISIKASGVPVSALNTVILDLGVFDLQEGEMIARQKAESLLTLNMVAGS